MDEETLANHIKTEEIIFKNIHQRFRDVEWNHKVSLTAIRKLQEENAFDKRTIKALQDQVHELQKLVIGTKGETIKGDHDA